MPYEEHTTSDSALQTFKILAELPVKELARQILPNMGDLNIDMRDWVRTGQKVRQSRDAEVWFTVRTAKGRRLRIVFNPGGFIPAEGAWTEDSTDHLFHKILDAPNWHKLSSILNELSPRVAEAINLQWDKAQREVSPTDRILSASEVAERYGVDRSTIWRWTKLPKWVNPTKLPKWVNPTKLPAPIVTTKGNMWRLEDLEKWDAEQDAKKNGAAQ